jgi:hypothetical protein
MQGKHDADGKNLNMYVAMMKCEAERASEMWRVGAGGGCGEVKFWVSGRRASKEGASLSFR